MQPLTVLSHLRPRFADLPDNYGHARSRRRAGLKGEIQCNVRVVQRTRAAHDNRLNGYPLPHADDFTYQLHVCCIPA